MRKFSPPLTLLAGMLLVSMHASPAEALLNHTWVASSGSNASSCDISAPCATFNGAYGKTAVGGEITCVDSGNYGDVDISHSITIDCQNAIGSNALPGGVVIGSVSIFSTATTDIVTLRGLDLDGLGLSSGSTSGLIKFTGAGVLDVNKVKINNLRGLGNGILFTPSGPAKLFVSDSHITDNGSSGIAAGILIQPASGVQASVTIDRTRIENNFFGIIADGTGGGSIRGVVRDSVVSGNVHNGITVSASGAGVAVLMVENTTVAGNDFGLVASGTNAGMLVSHSSVAVNNTGLFATGGGVLLSYKNNNLNGNTTTDGAFTGVIAQQ
jgi:hypothetical protein